MAKSDDEEPVLTEPGRQLDLLSVHELEARIEALEAEIVRCREAIKQKSSARSAADAVFGSKG